MIELSTAQVNNMVVHIVGNKLRQEGVRLSNTSTQITDNVLMELLFRHFLQPFSKTSSIYNFSHNSNLSFNETYVYLKSLFKNPESLVTESVRLARNLYEKSIHPRVRGGEFFVLYITNCLFDGRSTDAVGIFKVETKDTFLKVTERENGFQIRTDEGINIGRLDKACLVFNTQADTGYRLVVIDNNTKGGEEARYWKDEFLNVHESQTEESITQSYMQMASRVIGQMYSDEDAEQKARVRTKAINYFEDNDMFNYEKFVKQVFLNEENANEHLSIERKEQEERREIYLPEEFNISKQTVAKIKRRTRNVIQLDTNFELLIKGFDENTYVNLERDYDTNRGMYYYKIYFNTER